MDKKNVLGIVFWIIILIAIIGFPLHGYLSEWLTNNYHKDIDIIGLQSEVGFDRYKNDIITTNEISIRLDKHIKQLNDLENKIRGNFFLKGYHEESLLRDIEFNKNIAVSYRGLI